MPNLPLDRAARLTVEEERLRALPSFMFELQIFDEIQGVARGVTCAGDRLVELVVIFGTAFPLERPGLFTGDEEVKTYRHVTSEGQICTLRYEPDEWQPECLTAACLVKKAWKLIANRGVLGDDEDDGLPEAIELTSTEMAPYLLAPEDALPGNHRYGRASLQPGLIPESLVLTALKREDGKTFWQATDGNRLVKEGAFRPEVVWFKVAEPLPSKLKSLDDLNALMPGGMTYQDLLKLVSLPALSKNSGKARQILVQFVDLTGPRWALIKLQQKPSARRDKRRRVTEWVLGYLPTYVVGPDAYFGRLDGLLARDQLKQAHVAVVGVGALGSNIAFELSRSGVGQLTIFDGDTVQVGNPVRSLLPFSHLGKHKTDSLVAVLASHLPFTKVTGIPYSTANPKGHERLQQLLEERRFDLIVVAVGNHNTSRWLDSIFVKYDVPRLHTWATRGAAAGVVLSAQPNGFTYDAYHELIGSDSLPELPEDEVPYSTERGCLGPVMPATPIDLGSISIHAARTALDVLQSNEVAALQVWTRESRSWEDIEVLDKQSPNSLMRESLNMIPKTIRLSVKALITLTKLVRESPMRETGGVLLGECIGEEILVHAISGPGKRSRRTKNGIVLDTQYAQGCIDTASAMSNGQTRFLGEWHSHPAPPYTPSSRDVKTLKQLANSSTANIDIPVILIVGMDNAGDLSSRAYVWNTSTVELVVAS